MADNAASGMARSLETDDEDDIETLFCDESASKNSDSVKKLTEHPVSMETSTEKSAVFVQSWWRMTSARKSYREHLRPVHKVTFVITLIIRILVIIYLLRMLITVVNIIYFEKLDATSPAKSPGSLETSVLQELMMKDSSGNAIIATCSVLIFAYFAAQAYSIYSLVPRETRYETKKDGKSGRLNKILRAVTKSKIYKFYQMYRYPFIPIGLQIFETTSQMLSFAIYVSSVPTRAPLLVWALLLSLDNIITPWIVFHGEGTLGKTTQWDRVLPGLSLFFSLSYSFVVPLLMISTWRSIFGTVREQRFQDSTTGPFQYSDYAINYLIGAGDSGISFGFNATQGLFRVVGEEVYMSSILRLLSAYFPLLNVLLTLRNMESRYDTSKARSTLRERLLGHVAEYNAVHPETTIEGRSSVANGGNPEKKEQAQKCRQRTFKRAMKIMGFVMPPIMTSLSLIFITLVFYGAFRPVCEGPMWDTCYARTFHVFDFKTECPCVVYLATSEHEKPWSCNSDRDCAEYEWCASNFASTRRLECIPSVCSNNTRMSCQDSEHVDRDCRHRRKQPQGVIEKCKQITDSPNWTAEFKILNEYYPICDKHDDCDPGYYCRRGGFIPNEVRPDGTLRGRGKDQACKGSDDGAFPSPTGPNRCSKCEYCADLNDCPIGSDSHHCDYKNYNEEDLPTTDLPTIWKAIETNTKKSLVIFAIAGRPLQGSVDLKSIPDFVQLHTFVISNVVLLNHSNAAVCGATASPTDSIGDDESRPPGSRETTGANIKEDATRTSTSPSSRAQRKANGKPPGSRLTTGANIKEDASLTSKSPSSKEQRKADALASLSDLIDCTQNIDLDKRLKEKAEAEFPEECFSEAATTPVDTSLFSTTADTSPFSTTAPRSKNTPAPSKAQVTLTLPVPLNGCTFSGQKSTECATHLQVFIVNKFNVDIKFNSPTEGACGDLSQGRRDPELQVVLLSMLSHSTLTSIPEDFICDDRKSLTVFKVNNMGCRCQELEELDITCSTATLKHIPHSLGECSNLQVLDLDYSDLREIPPWLGKLRKLRYLGMEAATQGVKGHAPVVKFSSQLNYPDLTIANMGRNLFTGSKLPVDMFSNMPALNRLDISHSNLKTLPPSIGSLANLDDLMINDNLNLERLPDSIGSLAKVTSLIVSSSSITSLPVSIGSLHEVQRLGLGNMKLKTLPDSFCSLSKAVQIALNGNDLEDIPECFHKLSLQAKSLTPFSIRYIFKGCRNTRLKYNESHAGHRALRDMLNMSGTLRQNCSCAMTSMTKKCGCLDCFNPQIRKYSFFTCKFCSTREEQRVCLESSSGMYGRKL